MRALSCSTSTRNVARSSESFHRGVRFSRRDCPYDAAGVASHDQASNRFYRQPFMSASAGKVLGKVADSLLDVRPIERPGSSSRAEF